MPLSPALAPELPQALPQAIARALADRHLILTANQRAARTLRHIYNLRQRTLGLTHWPPPAILAYDTWLHSLWHQLLLEGHASALLLNSTQEHALWTSILAADPTLASTTLRPIDSLAELGASAFALLHTYRGRSRLAAAADTSDTRAFARWAAAFDRLCTRSACLAPAQLPEALTTAIAARQVSLPPALLLIGFDRQTPAQSALFEVIRATGIPIEQYKVERYPIEQHPPSPTRTLIEAPTGRDELTAAAHWLRAHLAANPAARLALILPDLEAIRPALDRTLRHILAPELEAIGPAETSAAATPFEFSLGIPLGQTPLASTALELLRWASAPLPIDRITALLLSPHFAQSTTPTDSSELLARAEFDAFTLRQQILLRPELSLEALLRLVSHPKSSALLTTLLHTLRALRTFLTRTNLDSDRPYAEWAVLFHELLATAGWPSAHLDSTEFQTLAKWQSAFDELSTLDFDNPRVPFATALRGLERIAARSLFAPESRHAPIQVMGPLESAGSTFDAIWFLRAGDLTWPIPSSPNPLLPFRLQHELEMPGPDPALDSALAHAITHRIAASAPTVLFSYARQSSTGEDATQRPSPALTGLDLLPIASTTLIAAAPPPTPIPLEPIPNDSPIPPPPDRVLPGGASILQSQAACGFRAFAEKRLSATPIDPVALGLDALDRGNLVHTILEDLWGHLETQAALAALTPAERDAALRHSIDIALAALFPNPVPGWPSAYIDTERERLTRLLTPWLNYELRRPPFRVSARELTRKDVAIGPLHIDIRIDRIDVPLAPGQPADTPGPEILLDYKTGPANPRQWLGPRPDAPQLPLYAVVAASTDLAAIAFANLRPGKDLGLTGYEAAPGTLPKPSTLPTPTLAGQIAQWRTDLEALALAFHSGDAAVRPRQYPQTCKFCGQRLLCRLNPATLATADDPDDPDPDQDPTLDLDSHEATYA